MLKSVRWNNKMNKAQQWWEDSGIRSKLSSLAEDQQASLTPDSRYVALPKCPSLRKHQTQGTAWSVWRCFGSFKGWCCSLLHEWCKFSFLLCHRPFVRQLIQGTFDSLCFVVFFFFHFTLFPPRWLTTGAISAQHAFLWPAALSWAEPMWRGRGKLETVWRDRMTLSND